MGIAVVFNSLIILAEQCYSSYRSFNIHEDFFLIENLENGCFDDIQIPSKLIHEKILRHKCLKEGSKNSGDSEILLRLKKECDNFNEDAHNNDLSQEKVLP